MSPHRRLPISARHAFALAFDLAVRRDPRHSLLVPLALRLPWILTLALLPAMDGPAGVSGDVVRLTALALAGDYIVGLVISAMLRFRARSVYNTPPSQPAAPALECYALGLRRLPWLFLTEVGRNLALFAAGLFLVLPGLWLGFRLSMATETTVLRQLRTSAAFSHSFQLTRSRLDELVPIGNAAMADRTFIEWDKDDIDVLGLMKVDILALGMLTCIRKAFDYLRDHEGRDMALADVPVGDPATYDMLCRGDSIGVFQVESRAQINMLPRLRPRAFYDLVIQVAIVRPGPIQGNMVHPYLRRRSGVEEVSFPSPAPPHDPQELHKVLKKTLGVPLFQEQAMQLAMVAAEFSDVEANQLRRAMATFRNVGTIGRFEHLMVERMVARGYERDFAQNCFEQIKGFGSYGFPESHAASFAKLVYISSWLKCHHPAIFAAALLNSQPMGFYAPAQIVRDAREHGVDVLPIDVSHSFWDNTLERGGQGALALRLGFRQAEGIHEAEARRLVSARRDGFAGVEDLASRAQLHGRPMRALADADAFRSLRLDRRQALWEVRRLPEDDPLPLFAVRRCASLVRKLMPASLK